MEDTDLGDLFFLDLPPSMFKPSQSQSSMSEPVLSTHKFLNQQVHLQGNKFLVLQGVVVYSKKKATITEPMQVQELKPTTSYEVNDPSFPKISPNFVDPSDLNLPIAIRKGTRTCTQHPLYPLSLFVSYERLLSSHRNFLTNLNTISIPKTLSEALNIKEWKQAVSQVGST